MKKAAKKVTTPTVKVVLKKIAKKTPAKKIAKNSSAKMVNRLPKSVINAKPKSPDLFDLITTTLKQTEKVLWERKADEFTELSLDGLSAALSWDFTPAFWALFDADSLFAQWYGNTPNPSIFIRGDIRRKRVIVHLRSTANRNPTTGMPE